MRSPGLPRAVAEVIDAKIGDKVFELTAPGGEPSKGRVGVVVVARKQFGLTSRFVPRYKVRVRWGTDEVPEELWRRIGDLGKVPHKDPSETASKI